MTLLTKEEAFKKYLYERTEEIVHAIIVEEKGPDGEFELVRKQKEFTDGGFDADVEADHG